MRKLLGISRFEIGEESAFVHEGGQSGVQRDRTPHEIGSLTLSIRIKYYRNLLFLTPPLRIDSLLGLRSPRQAGADIKGIKSSLQGIDCRGTDQPRSQMQSAQRSTTLDFLCPKNSQSGDVWSGHAGSAQRPEASPNFCRNYRDAGRQTFAPVFENDATVRP